MEENTKYPDQNENQNEKQSENRTSDLHQNDYVQDIQFIEQPETAEKMENGDAQAFHSEGIYKNEVHQNGGFQTGTSSNLEYQKDRYENNAWQNNNYQSGNYQNSTYSDNMYQNNSYQNGAYQSNVYQNNNYQNNLHSNNTYQNGNYQNNGYIDSNYSGNTYQNYGGSYQPYNGTQPYNNQMELEEPVKVSEWVLALVLMMIPCVNIIMMFVWAFSSTEKKSKSNFFKAYLIFFGISMVVMLLVWIAVVIFALTL